MKKERWECVGLRLLLLSVAVSAVLLCGCGGAVEPENAEPAEDSGRIQIGLSFDSFLIERWIRERDVFVSAAMELGADVNVQNANGDVQEQIEQIEYFIKKGMDVIAVAATDCDALSDVMKRAKEAGIKTVSYDRLIQNADCDLYISFDNEEVGRLMAKSLIANIPDGGRIFMIQGSPTDSNVDVVRKGFDEVMAGGKLQVVYEAYCDGWIAESAFDYVKEGLEKNPDIQGVMCGNEKATRLSGIDTNRVYFLAYLNMGLLAAVAGMITVARLNSANPTAGNSYEMDAIGACFIGGASAYGGTGTVPGVIIGATLMGVLNLGMSIMGVDQNLQKVVKGLVLMAAVIFDVVSKRKSFIVKQ